MLPYDALQTDYLNMNIRSCQPSLPSGYRQGFVLGRLLLKTVRLKQLPFEVMLSQRIITIVTSNCVKQLNFSQNVFENCHSIYLYNNEKEVFIEGEFNYCDIVQFCCFQRNLYKV